jgi:parallel beta-helix repeat protein
VPVPTAQTLYVDDDGFCGGLNVTCYRQLAEALRVSEDGDTVFVFSGRYTSASVDHAVAIIGEDRDGVVVDGRGVAGLAIAATGVEVRNLTITNATDGLTVRFQGSLLLQDVTISAGSGIGVRAVESAGITIRTSRVTGNAEDGILLENVTGSLLQGNDVSGNLANGVTTVSGDSIRIEGNAVQGNRGWGIEAYRTTNITVLGNDVVDNGPPSPISIGLGVRGEAVPTPMQGAPTGGGIKYWETDPTAVEDNLIAGNRGVGIFLLGSIDVTVRGNDVNKNDVGIEVNATLRSQVFHNNFLSNRLQLFVVDSNSTTFDDGDGQGNYWDDYRGADDGSGVGRFGETRVAGDGIGDTNVPHLGQDWYPYMVRDGWNVTKALLEIKPETLNGKSQGQFVTVFLGIADGTDPTTIRIETVRLWTQKGSVYAEPKMGGVSDRDGDGIPEVMLKFDRGALLGILWGGDVTINVSGELEDGRAFFGTDTVHVIHMP